METKKKVRCNDCIHQNTKECGERFKAAWRPSQERLECGEAKKKTQTTTYPEPPLGIIPKYIWEEDRLDDLVDAIRRRIDAKFPIKEEWIKEYNELIEKGESEMKIPNTVKVGSMIYSVVVGDEVLVIDCKTCKGTIEYEKHLIKINNVVQDSQGMEQSFLHELIHAIVRERNIVLDGTNEDLEVDEIARGLHGIIVDNPGIFTGGEK